VVRVRLSAAAFLALLCLGVAALAINFPALTGRIVDQANVIPVETRTALEPKLADLEAKSGIQLVVATVTSLEGHDPHVKYEGREYYMPFETWLPTGPLYPPMR